MLKKTECLIVFSQKQLDKRCVFRKFWKKIVKCSGSCNIIELLIQSMTETTNVLHVWKGKEYISAEAGEKRQSEVDTESKKWKHETGKQILVRRGWKKM